LLTFGLRITKELWKMTSKAVTKAGTLFKQRTVRYLKDGKQVPASTPGAERVVEESSKWYGRFRDPTTGKWKSKPLFKDQQSSRIEYAKREKQLERREVGLEDPYAVHKAAPIQSHIEDYLISLREQNRDDRYRNEAHRLINAVVSACKVRILKDIVDHQKVDTFLAGFRQWPATHLC
jgi:hypothetical protein